MSEPNKHNKELQQKMDRSRQESESSAQLEALADMIHKSFAQWRETLKLISEDEVPSVDSLKNEEKPSPQLVAHLLALHQQWDIGKTLKDSATSVEAEPWFRALNELNNTWDIRSHPDQLPLSEERKADLRNHYPQWLLQLSGHDPGLADSNLEPLHHLREELSSQIAQLHQRWEIDASGKNNEKTTRGKSTSLKEKARHLIKKAVRIHTDPLFQQQRDFNAAVVQMMEQLIQKLDDRQRRNTRALLELTNRQFLFNLAIVRFINECMQSILLNRQKQFNAQTVQLFQEMIQNLPQLVVERTEILIEKLAAEIESLRQELKEGSK